MEPHGSQNKVPNGVKLSTISIKLFKFASSSNDLVGKYLIDTWRNESIYVIHPSI